eukprot:6213900-Pleurochrysis_carterae.AAC.2
MFFQAANDLEENMWPGWCRGDTDWAENGQVLSAREVQQEYWNIIQYSLFVSIWSWLDTAAWLNTEGTLEVGAAVTVEPEESACSRGVATAADDLCPPSGSFFARIECSPQAEEGMYRVRKQDGTVVEAVVRRCLRHRCFFTKAVLIVTSEKRHDAATTQHCFNTILPHIHSAVPTLTRFTLHSDNASHFKSRTQANYWSRLRVLHPWLAAVDCEFGPPGHGKGPWDGLGAVAKSKVLRDILNNKIRTESGVISSSTEVAEHLRNTFQTEEWRREHDTRKINEIEIMEFAPHDVSERAEVELHEFEALVGQLSMYSFKPIVPGVVAARSFSCWCDGCCRAVSRGEGLDANLVCVGCESEDKRQWIEKSVNRMDASGIAQRRAAAQRRGHELAKSLKPGQWLAVQARNDGDDLWIGKGLDAGNSSCIVKKVSERSEMIDGTMYTRGDSVIKVEWWVRDPEDHLGLTYSKWEPEMDGIPLDFFFNSTELRLVNFKMNALPVAQTPIRRHRRSSRLTAVAMAAAAVEESLSFVMPADTEQDILARCW